MWSRLTVHPTPLDGSWLNQAEIELSRYSRQCLGRRRIPAWRHCSREEFVESVSSEGWHVQWETVPSG